MDKQLQPLSVGWNYLFIPELSLAPLTEWPFYLNQFIVFFTIFTHTDAGNKKIQNVVQSSCQPNSLTFNPRFNESPTTTTTTKISNAISTCKQ